MIRRNSIPNVAITTWRVLGRPATPGLIQYDGGIVEITPEHIEAAAMHEGFCVVVLAPVPQAPVTPAPVTPVPEAPDQRPQWKVVRVGARRLGKLPDET